MGSPSISTLTLCPQTDIHNIRISGHGFFKRSFEWSPRVSLSCIKTLSRKTLKCRNHHLFSHHPTMDWEDHVERILWTEQQISDRVSELASEISDDLKGFSSCLVFVGVATGAFLFMADLVRKIRLPLSVDFIRVESYGFGTESNGAPTITSDVKTDVKGKHVILVEEIVDTGNTLSCLLSHLGSKGASSVSVCTFLDKPTRRKVHFELVGQGKFYRGFECPNYFVVGYGLDFAEHYRNLPYIGVLKPELYK